MSEMPYPGLRPFKREESDIFFGREKQTDLLLEKLAQTRFISVVGLSGCGKSSLVRAGMLAALETGYLSSAGARWQMAAMRPGDHPLHNLIETLCEDAEPGPGQDPAKENERLSQLISMHGPLGLVEIFRQWPLPSGTNLLLLVDQFEEIFRYHRQGNRNEAELFVALLLTSAEQREIPIYVVTTMRSDFIGDCALFRGLPEMMNRSQFLVPRLTREQQRMAIIGPARVFGDDLEPRLVNRLLDEMGTDPDQLPLLQHCLMRMWFQVRAKAKQRESGRASEESSPFFEQGIVMTMEDYDAAGGFKGALSKHADEAYNELTEQQQKIAEHLFRCLSEHGPAHRDTRRLVEVREVATVSGVTDEQVIEVVDVFREPSRCFITPPAHVPLTTDSVLDISHESLIRQWRRMAKWVEQETESANIYQRLEQTASLWKQGQAALWRTPDLEIALAWQEQQEPTAKWAARYGGNFDLAIAFLESSAKAQEEQRLKQQREREEQRIREEREHEKERELSRMRRRLALGAVAVVVLIVAVFAMGLLWKKASDAEEEARRQSGIAKEQAKIAQSAREDAEHQARLLASNQLALQAQSTLDVAPQRSALLAVEALQVTRRQAEAPVPFAEDILRKTLKNTGVYGFSGHEGAIWNVLFTPDHRWLISGSVDGTVRLWNLQAGERFGSSTVLFEHEKSVRHLAISTDSQWLASGSEDGVVRLRNLQDSSIPLREFSAHKGQLSAIEISPDTRWLVTSDAENTLLWSLDGKESSSASVPIILTGQSLLSWWVETHISPDSHWLATCQKNGIVTLWDLTTADPSISPILLTGHQQEIRTLAFSPDSQRLATGSRDATVRLWDLSANAPVSHSIVLEGHADEIRTVLFSPDTHWLVTGSRNDPPRLWNLTLADPSSAPGLLSGHEGSVYRMVFSPDKRWLVTGGQDGTVRLWNLQSDDPVTHSDILGKGSGSIFGLDMTLDNHWLIARSFNGAILRWDLHTLKTSARPIVLAGPKEISFRTAFSSDSRWMASGSQRNIVWLWDLTIENPELTPITLPVSRKKISTLAFSPDAAQLFTGRSSGEVTPWSVAQKKPGAASLVFQEDTDEKSSLYLLSPDGRWLANGQNDATITLFDLQAQDPLSTSVSLSGHEGEITALAFSPDGRWLATGSDDRAARLWDLRTNEPADFPQILQGGHQDTITAVAFSRDNRWLATGSEDMTVRLWDIEAAESLKTSVVFQGHEDAVTAIAFSPDQRWLVTGSRDQIARLWPLQPGQTASADGPIILHGHEGSVTHIAITSDGHKIITGSSDGTLRLWDALSEKPAASSVLLEGHLDSITAMAISQGDQRLATASEDGTVKIWLLHIDDLIHLACQTAGRNMSYDEWQQYFQEEPYQKTCPEFPIHSSAINRQ